MSEPAAPRLHLPVRPPGATPLASLPSLARSPLERCTRGDLFHDYVLTPYHPQGDAVGRLRSVNLLIESFALAGVEAEGLEVIRLLRERLGPFRTVWGIKQYEQSDVPHGWE